MRAPAARLLLAAVTVLALAGGACSPEGSGSAGTTRPTKPAEPTTTTTTQPSDPYAIPEVIDEAYVNRVLAALDQIDGDVLRRVVATGGIDAEVPKMLRAIYNEPQYEEELDAIRRVLTRGLDKFRNPPGNRRTIVARLIEVRADCVFFEGRTDSSAVLKEVDPEPANEVEIFTLRPTEDGADPAGINPTPWSIANAEIIHRGDVPAGRATCDG